MTKAIHARYSRYQTLDIQFTSDKITGFTAGQTASFDVEIFYMPGLVVLQELMQDPNVRNYGFDTLVKGAVPVSISVQVEVRYRQGVAVPEVEEVQNIIASTINGVLLGQELLHSSDVVYACKIVFTACEVQLPFNMYA